MRSRGSIPMRASPSRSTPAARSLRSAWAAGPARRRLRPDPAREAEHGQLVGLERDVGQGVVALVDAVARLVLVEGVDVLGDERDAELAQLVLVALEHPLEGLGRRRAAVLRHELADLGLAHRPTRVEQHEDEVEQALGLDLGRARRTAPGIAAHPPERYPTDTLPTVMQWRAGTVVGEVRRWPGAVELTVALAGGGDDGRRDRPVRALAYTAMVGVARGRRARPPQRLGAAARAGHRRPGVRRRAHRHPARRPAGRPRPHRQGALHAAAADAPRRRRAGQPAPRRARRGRRPRRDCPSSSPTSTRPCPRSSPASGTSARGPGSPTS